MNKTMNRELKILICFFACAALIFVVRSAFAADGSGTATVSPNHATVGTSGNTHTITYTAAEAFSSSMFTIDVPASWTPPQGTAGLAGYTTAVAGSTGIVGTVLNNLSTTANWNTTKHQVFADDTVDKQVGVASLANTISSSAVAGEQWYFNPGATNWGGSNVLASYRIGMWLKSSVTTASGNLSWVDDDTASLASPLDVIAIPALTADTWTYTSVTLPAFRTSILSYGFRYTTDIGAATVRADSASVLFDAAEAATNWAGGNANVTVATLTTVGDFKEGSAALRCAFADAAVTNDKCRRSGSNVTIGPTGNVSMWVRSSVDLASGDVQFMADNTAALASPEAIAALPALTANTWTFIQLTFAGSANLVTASYGFNQTVDKGAFTLDVDAIGKLLQGFESSAAGVIPTTLQTLSADATVFHQGTASLKNTITASAAAGDAWYETLSTPQDWTNYTRVAMWVRSSVSASAGALKFQYSSANDLTSPIASLDLPALSANTWTYANLTLTGTRNSINSYGINYATDIGAASIYLDHILAGPGAPTFSGNTITVETLLLSTGQTVDVVYGNGGGVSGATAPSVAETSTFTTKSKIGDSGTLTNIASQPTVTVHAVPVLTIVTPPPTLTKNPSVSFTFNSTAVGTLSYGGSCTSGTPSSVGSGDSGAVLSMPNNPVGVNGVTYSDCTLTLTDSYGVSSNVLAIPAFTLDTKTVTWSSVSLISNSTNSTQAKVGDTVTLSLTASEPIVTPTIAIKSGGTAVTNPVTITNTSGNTWTASYITSSSDIEGSVTFTASAQDLATNGSSQASSTTDSSSVTFDKTAPSIFQSVAVPNPTNDNTPNYRFSSFEGGTIVYGGDCTSVQTNANGGTTTVTFSTLTDGIHSNCTINVRDIAGNVSNTLNVPSFTVDTVLPVITEVTPVSTLTNDPTPAYVFSSTEVGTITYGGACTSETTAAIEGNNSISFSTLVDGSYSDCTIRVRDAATNNSTLLTVSAFSIDTESPVLAEVTPIVSPSAGMIVSYTFSTTKAGTITYGGGCSSVTTTATLGDNTVQFLMPPNPPLTNGVVYDDCTIVVTDASGNASNTLAVTSFIIDTTAPYVTEVTPITTPTSDSTPEYVFNTDEAGAITYGGACSSVALDAISGDNTVTFDELTDGTYEECTIIVTDAVGNSSDPLLVTAFTVATLPPTARFVIIDPTDSVAGTSVTVTIHALRSDDSIDTDFQNDVTLITSGSATGAGLVDIINGVGTIQINDLTAETVTLSLVDSEVTALDVTSTQTVTFAPTAAVVSKFVITDPADAVTRRPVVVTVTARKTDDTIDTDYQQDVTLFTSGAATGAGLVDIINGVGTITITDAVAETVLLALSDTEGTGLDVSSTQNIVFRRGGGTTTLPTLVQFSGRAYPNARLSILTKDKDQLVGTEVQSAIISNRDGVFAVTLNEMPIKVNKTYGLAITDADGRATQTKFYTLEILPEKTVSKIVFVPPTISAVRTVASKQGTVEFIGYMTPKNELSFELDGKEFSAKPVIESSGFYSLSIRAATLTAGMHTIRATQRDGAGVLSDSSLAAVFTVSDFIPETDLNGDGVVTISDWSIFLLIWGSDDTDRRKRIDFNHDSRITVSDLSIFIQTMK